MTLHQPAPLVPESAALIRAEDVSLAYGHGATVLQAVNFRLMPAEIVTVVGPNGSGKSSFLKALMGSLKPQRGTIWRKPGLRVGYVPQTLHLDPNMPLNVGRFLSLLQPLDRESRDRLLTRVGIPGLAEKPMSSLSGGQKQRALLAQAIAGRPEVLVLDEPTQGLDQPGIAAFYRLIEDLRRELGCAVLSVSHDLHVVMSASDRVICLNGHVCCEGTPEVVSNAPEYRALFGLGTGGALALYRHVHDHDHHHDHGHDHSHDNGGPHAG